MGVVEGQGLVLHKITQSQLPCFVNSLTTAMISYNVVVGDTLSKVLVQFAPSLGASMGTVRFFVVFLVTLVCMPRCRKSFKMMTIAMKF